MHQNELKKSLYNWLIVFLAINYWFVCIWSCKYRSDFPCFRNIQDSAVRNFRAFHFIQSFSLFHWSSPWHFSTKSLLCLTINHVDEYLILIYLLPALVWTPSLFSGQSSLPLFPTGRAVLFRTSPSIFFGDIFTMASAVDSTLGRQSQLSPSDDHHSSLQNALAAKSSMLASLARLMSKWPPSPPQ